MLVHVHLMHLIYILVLKNNVSFLLSLLGIFLPISSPNNNKLLINTLDKFLRFLYCLIWENALTSMIVHLSFIYFLFIYYLTLYLVFTILWSFAVNHEVIKLYVILLYIHLYLRWCEYFNKICLAAYLVHCCFVLTLVQYLLFSRQATYYRC